MITYEKLSENSQVFYDLCGMTLDDFNDVYESFERMWIEAEEDRLGRPDRRRALGGGSQYALGLSTHLIMVILWLRLYLTTEAVGSLFNLHKSSVSRNGRRIWQVLRQVRQPEFVWPDPPKRGHGHTLAQALRNYPALYAAVDAMQLPVPLPQAEPTPWLDVDGAGKKKRQTSKPTRGIKDEWGKRSGVHASPGNSQEIEPLHPSRFVDKFSKDVDVIGDAGFDGTIKGLPDPRIATSLKARRNHALADDVTVRIRDAIICGCFKPGEPLREEQLAAMFQYSRGPVREALCRLELEGLVQVRRHRGATVSWLSPRDVEEVYTLRMALERLAVQNAVARAQEQDFVALEKVIAAFDKELAQNPSEHEIARLDLQFHDIIYQAARHQRLLNSWTNLRAQIFIFLLSRNVANPDFRDLTIGGHTAILNVLRERDEEKAISVIEEHLTAAYERVVVDFARRKVGESTPAQALING